MFEMEVQRQQSVGDALVDYKKQRSLTRYGTDQVFC